MRYSWIFIIVSILLFALIVLAFYRYQKRSKDRKMKHVAVIAHTRTIKMLPAYRRAARRYHILLIVAAISFLTSIFAFTAVAARPMLSQEKESDRKNRDIMLCLDASNSMSAYQASLLEHLRVIANALRGERIGITIFDGVPANVIPLSDDYDAIIDIINELANSSSAYSTAMRKGGIVSAIGDGVMGCVNSFDKLEDEKRSKSVIILTDNQAGGNETVTINQAARYAMRYGVTFYGISTNKIGNRETSEETRFRNAVTATGGSFYNINDTSFSNDVMKLIVKKIFEQEEAKISGAPEIIYGDNPTILLFVSGISFALFIGTIWRLRL